LLNKDQEISRRDYLATKELPALPKKQKGIDYANSKN